VPRTSPIETLTEWIRSSALTVAFTGAGMSTESGIADFRSPGGVWSRFTPVYYQDFIASREARVRYWRMRRELYREFAGAKPNAGHRALAQLEACGRLGAIITQNIDGLHQDAGSRRVIELHGTARVIACIACDRERPVDEVMALVEADEDAAPDCEACGAPIKAKTIAFGQPMPEAQMQESAALATEATLFLAIGSSLTVEPAASLPRLAHQCGAKLVIINRTETPLDREAHLLIRNAIGETMAEVLRGVA
jgi:NAD-dependent deacetylase